MDIAFQPLVHLLTAAAQVALLVWALGIYRRSRRVETLIVAAVLIGLVYDNAALGLGAWFGHGPTLAGLSYPRFVIHALATPLLIVAGLGAVAAAGHRWARTFAVVWAVGALTFAMVAWGFATDVLRLELEPRSEAGVVSYSNAAAVVPVPAIVTVLALIAFGTLLWRRPGWPWLTVGSVAMIAASAVMASDLLVNVGELALLLSLVATEAEAARWSAAGAGRGEVAAPGAGRSPTSAG